MPEIKVLHTDPNSCTENQTKTNYLFQKKKRIVFSCYFTTMESKRQEAICVLKRINAIATLSGIGFIVTGIALPYRVIWIPCALLAYGCYEVCKISTNCQGIYNNPVKEAKARLSRDALLSMITHDAPISTRIAPAIVSEDFGEQFFP